MDKSFNERPQGARPSNTIPNPREDIKVITTHSGITLAGPSLPSPTPSSNENEIPDRNPHQPPIPYPSRLNMDKLQDKYNIQTHKFLQMFKTLHFNISFAEELAHMPKYAKVLKDMLTNKCQHQLNAPIGVEKLMLSELTPTRMTLELANRSVANLVGIVEDVFVQVGKFVFPVDFIVIDYDIDPRVPLILGRPLLRMTSALVDVHGKELTLGVGDEKLTLNVKSTSEFFHKHRDESINQIDIIDTTWEDHLHESDEDESFEADNLELNSLIREPSNTFLMEDKEIELNTLDNIDDLISIPK
ncbi:reverse transcriptase domain-containing protein, partial [Tanacetum coccineum]